MKDTKQISIRGKKVCNEFVAIVKAEAAELGIAPEVAAILSGYVSISIDGEPATNIDQVLKHYNMVKSLKALNKIIKQIYLEVLEEDTDSLLKEM